MFSLPIPYWPLFEGGWLGCHGLNQTWAPNLLREEGDKPRWPSLQAGRIAEAVEEKAMPLNWAQKGNVCQTCCSGQLCFSLEVVDLEPGSLTASSISFQWVQPYSSLEITPEWLWFCLFYNDCANDFCKWILNQEMASLIIWLLLLLSSCPIAVIQKTLCTCVYSPRLYGGVGFFCWILPKPPKALEVAAQMLQI